MAETISPIKNRSIRVARVLKMFKKSGASGDFTKPFSDLTNVIQRELLSHLENGESETAILASYRNTESWVVITSDRLVWHDADATHAITWEQVRDATIPVSALAALKSSAKLKNAVLEISTDFGKVELLIEPGKPFSGFWNVLKMMASFA